MRRALFSVAVLCVSCAGPQVRSDLSPPAMVAEEFQVVSQSLSECAVKYTGTIESPSEPVTVEKASFELVVDGKVLTSGDKPIGVEVPAGEKTSFSLEQTFPYVKDLDELKAMDVKGGSLLLALRGTLAVKVKHADGKTEALQLPFARSREVRTPRLPHVKLQELEAGRFGEDEVLVTFHVAVVNPNPFQVFMSSLEYTATLAGKPVGSGTLGQGDRVSPASTGVFDIQVTMNEETHGKDVVKIIKGLKVPYTLKGKLVAATYEEALEASGEIKLNPPK